MKEIVSLEEFDNLLNESARFAQVLVVDFFADWCGPCQRVAPLFENLGKQYFNDDVIFAKVNCDKCHNLSQREQISALPSFKLYKNRICVGYVRGAQLSKLEYLIRQHYLFDSVMEINSCEKVPIYFYARANFLGIAKSALFAAENNAPFRIELAADVFEDYFLTLPGFMLAFFDLGLEEAGDAFILPPNPNKARMKRLIRQLSGPPPSSVQVEDPFFSRLVDYKRQIRQYFNPESQKAAREVVPQEKLLAQAAAKSKCRLEEVTPVDFLQELLVWFKDDFFSWVDKLECLVCSTVMNMSSGTPTPEERRLGGAGRAEVFTCPSDRAHPVRRFPRYNNPCYLLKTREGRCGEWANCFALILTSLYHTNNTGIPWFRGVRFVVDFTDHVWCEVWLEGLDGSASYGDGSAINGRWVHVDPCEGLIDAALVYEVGWKKKLSYVIAFTVPPLSAQTEAAIDLQDVTWRYTTDFQSVLSRRNGVDEQLFAAYLAHTSTKAVEEWRAAGISGPPFTLTSILAEVVEFFQPSKVDPSRNPEVLQGRKTGSVEWRSERGELGHSASTSQAPHASIWEGSASPIQPTEFEQKLSCLYLRYSCALDAYARPYANAPPADSYKSVPLTVGLSDYCPRRAGEGPSNFSAVYRQGWQSMATRWKNVFRKHEKDWKMTYLARKETGCDSTVEGIVEWCIDLSGTAYSVHEVTLFVTLVSFDDENKVAFIICCGDESNEGASCLRITPGSSPIISSADFVGAKKLSLTGRFWSVPSNGKFLKEPRLAWQKAQLFRQKDSDSQAWPFELKITLKKDENDESP